MSAEDNRAGAILYRVFDRLTRPPMLAVFAILGAVAVGVVGVRYLAGISGPVAPGTDKVVTGDYLAFLTGANVLAENGGALYDLKTQLAVQARIVGMPLASWQPYVNPPLFALLLRPVVRLSFVQGFYLYTAVAIAVAVLGAFALVGVARSLARGRLEAVTVILLALGFHPIARTMLGGQNTVFTFALATGALWALQTGRPIVAGALVGLLSYKPQYVPLFFAALVLARAWPAVIAAVVGFVAHYVAGAALIGADWPLRLMATMRPYRVMEAANVATHFSLMPFFEYAIGGRVGTLLALACAVGVLIALVRYAPRVRPGDADFPLTWVMLLVGAMLLSPHLQYYDFGVLVLPVVVGLDTTVRRGSGVGLWLRLAIAAVYVAYPTLYEAYPVVRFQPLTLLMLALFVWLCRLGHATRGQSPSRPPAPSH